MQAANLEPLWPSKRGFLPHGAPHPCERLALPRDSASAVFHVVQGEVEAQVAGVELTASGAEDFAAPAHAPALLANRSTTRAAVVFRFDDAPLQRKIGIYEQFAN